jgi:SRSO17 transposase
VGTLGDRAYYWSNFPPTPPLVVLVEYAHRRHHIERFHQDAKGELGWDQYQGRLWLGFHRHAVLVMLSYSFLVWQEWQQRQQQPVTRGGRVEPFAPRLDRRAVPWPRSIGKCVRSCYCWRPNNSS